MSQMIIKTDFEESADVEIPNVKKDEETHAWNRDIWHALNNAGYKVKPLNKKKSLIKKIIQVD